MAFLILQIIVSVLLIAAILLQAQGSGLSSAFGGKSEIYRSKRSMEKLLVYGTGVIAALFAILALILLAHR